MKIRIAGTAALLGAAVLAGCGTRDQAAHEDVRPVRSIVAGASDGSVGATYAGTIQARYESKLGFQASGRIAARLVEVGTQVKRGQPLLRLDPSQEALQLASAAADVDAARSRVAQNRVDLQRTEQLQARAFASQAEVDQQRLALAESESRLKSALAQQGIKANQRSYTELVADRDGVVSAIHAEAGQVVSPGQAIVTLAGDGEREVVVSIPEQRVDELRRAKTFEVSVWAQPGQRWSGSLRELAPDTDSVTRTYSARIAVRDPANQLRLGMTATVRTPDVDGATAIRLPLTAIHHKDGTPRVWIVDAKTSTVAPREVKLGSAQDDSVLIASGLAGGETVVTAGVNQLHPGQKVKAAASATGAQVAQGRQP